MLIDGRGRATGRYENWHTPWCVIHGDGSTAQLPAELDRLGAKRVFLLTTRSLERQGTIRAQVEAGIGARLAGTFTRCGAHAPRPTVIEAADAARAAGADCLVALGGSSVTDAARAVAVAISEDVRTPQEFDRLTIRFRYPDPPEIPEYEGPSIPIVSLPTTLSAGEFTYAAGMANEITGAKVVLLHDRITPVVVILDPALTEATPRDLWISTGIKSMSDAMEQICSTRPHPIVDALTARCIEGLYRSLPRSLEGDRAAVLDCMVSAWCNNFALFSANTLHGIGAGLRHQIGGLTGIPHGEITCVLLPHVLDFNLPAVPDLWGAFAAMLGLSRPVVGEEAGEMDSIVASVATFIGQLGMPTTLRAIGLKPEDVPRIAELAMEDFTTVTNPRPVTVEALIAVLEAAW